MKQQLPERGTPPVPGAPCLPWGVRSVWSVPPFPERWEQRDTVVFVHLLGLKRRCEQGIVPSRKNPLPLDQTTGNSPDS